MRDLAQDALDLLDDMANGASDRTQAATELRKMELEARALLADAGFPAEAAWRALQRAAQALALPDPDPAVVEETSHSLTDAVATLDSITAGPAERDADFRIIG